jgi:calcineurin-like phosphoesterase family protein
MGNGKDTIMRFWVTTDTHLGHDNIARYCNRPNDYNERIINGLSVLEYDDVLIHMGDVAFTDEWERKYLGHLPCKKWLILGNHDKSYTYHMKLGWDWVGETMTLRRFGKLIRFSHKPAPLGEEDIQFYGHFHNNDLKYCEPYLVQLLTYKHYLMVLEDLDYQLVTLESLIKKHDNRRNN